MRPTVDRYLGYGIDAHNRQAFEAMRRFVAQFAEREPSQYRERFDQLVRWTEIESAGGTSDPAQWHDWEAVVAAVLAEG